MRRPNIKRRVALAGGTALIAGAGVGGYLGMGGGPSSIHLTAAPAVQAPAAASETTGATAPDTDNVQQGGQTGVQDTTGADTTAAAGTTATGAEAPSTEVDGPGGNADPAGSAGQDGNFNN